MRRLITLALLALALGVPGAAQYHPRSSAGPEAVVNGWYQRYLNRQMDPYAAGWIQALRQGQDPNQVLAAILGSDEYYQLAGSTPTGFAQKLYQDIVGRPPSPRELSYWTARVLREARNDVAYALLTRYPQELESHPPPRRWRHPYEYRRPNWRYSGRDR